MDLILGVTQAYNIQGYKFIWLFRDVTLSSKLKIICKRYIDAFCDFFLLPPPLHAQVDFFFLHHFDELK